MMGCRIVGVASNHLLVPLERVLLSLILTYIVLYLDDNDNDDDNDDDDDGVFVIVILIVILT